MESEVEISPFILNSIPKSGTHLLKQILLGIPGMSHNPDKGMFGHISYQSNNKLNELKKLGKNEFVNGHLFFSNEWSDYFKECNMKQIFVYRDPRDVVVSYAYFIPTLDIHPLYETFIQEGFTHRERMKFLLRGGEPIGNKPIQPNLYAWYTSFSSWINKENTHSVRFEDFVENEDCKKLAIEGMLNFITQSSIDQIKRKKLVNSMVNNINPLKCPTFRKGKIGSWKNEFDDELTKLFKENAGNLLMDLKYEKSNDW
jgi:Sulfotransferase domain